MSNIGTKFILAQRFIFDPNSNLLIDQTNETEDARLGSNESRILLMLSERPNQVISRHELHEYVWREQGFEVDDSSLTQAISTLRKMLQDSTKSPLFIKTVPKRGYQFIASVERSVSYNQPDISTVEPKESSDPVDDNTPTTIESVNQQSEQAPVAPISTDFSVPAPVHNKKDTLSNILLILAIILPLFVYVAASPTPTQFIQLAQFDGVPIKTLKNHPDLSDWLPSIKKCVIKYKQIHQTKNMLPFDVIATGGQNDHLMLNYVYAAEESKHNTSISIYANNPERNTLCN